MGTEAGAATFLARCVLACLVVVSVAACGGGDGEPEALSEPDQQLLGERLDQWGSELLAEHDEIGYGGMFYSPRDRAVVGGVPDGVMEPVAKCQLYADRLDDLDGPTATVPVQIITTSARPGEEHVLAEGVGGGRCKEK